MLAPSSSCRHIKGRKQFNVVKQCYFTRQGPIGNIVTCLTLVQRAVPEEACCSRRLLPCNAMWPCYCLGRACKLGAPTKNPAFAMHLSFASISDTELCNTETILFGSCMAYLYLLFTFVSHDAFHVSFMRIICKVLRSTSYTYLRGI